MILPSVFVEIPAQNASLPSTKTSSIPRHGEIKAELSIKSEIDHVNHTHSISTTANATITTTTIATTTKSKDATHSIPSTSSKDMATCESAKLMASLVTARPKVKCLKCDKCPFISISQIGYDEHIRSAHTDADNSTIATSRKYRNKLLCPGCENIFYSKMSLKIHLVNDHQMNRSDIKQLLSSLLVKNSAISNNEPLAQKPAGADVVLAQSNNIAITNSRRIEPQKIYLKNVEVLQNPKFAAHRYNTENLSPMNLTTVEIQGSSINNMLTINNGNYELPTTITEYEQVIGDNSFEQQNIVAPISTYSFVSPPQTNIGHSSLNHCHSESVIFNSISPIITPPTIDESNGIRPDSGHSVKFCEPLQQTWTTNASTNSNINLVEYTTALNLNAMTAEGSANVSRMPNALTGQNEQKKIFIKNIDILMKPILHLRTVDEVNLLINKPNEQKTFDPIENITLNEDDYRYMFDDNTNDYNSIIPDCLESNISEFMFTEEINPSEFYSNSNSSYSSNNNNIINTDSNNMIHSISSNNIISLSTDGNNIDTINSNNINSIATDSSYSIINLDSNIQTFTTSTNIPTDYSMECSEAHSEQRVMNCNSFLNMNAPVSSSTLTINGYADQFASNQFHDINYSEPNSSGLTNQNEFGYNGSGKFFPNLPAKALDTTVDFMFVSSDEIIDTANVILDLTHDEVEQILDDNLISVQDLDVIGSATNMLAPDIESFKRPPRINIATNLIKGINDSTKEFGGKLSSDMAVEDMLNVDIDRDSGLLDEMSIEMAAGEVIDQCAQNDTDVMLKRRNGRPKGARQINAINSRKKVKTIKCSIGKCAMRFVNESTIQIHQQCHALNTDEIRCPKCDDERTLAGNASNQNWNWNTLHTHLWREHNIDMELFSCPHCAFKTPILSRLNNTHMKIHSESRDFKCDYCSKAFKNARQMKNHRRIHKRSQSPTIRQCKYCGQSFYNAKHLKEHQLTHAESIADQLQPITYQCDVCTAMFRSKLKLRVHLQTHCDEKRYVCEFGCGYKSNDHSCIRRHQMTHNKQMKYKCALCPFQCIQSTNYKNHILKKHPDTAKEFMYMCERCNLVTVNKKIFELHCLNHDNQR